jgi:hypothetical protein
VVQNYGLKVLVQHFPVFAVFATSTNQSFRALIRWIEPFWAIGKKPQSPPPVLQFGFAQQKIAFHHYPAQLLIKFSQLTFA